MALLHPIFPLLVRRPDLIAAHLGGYLALLRQESATTGVDLLRRGLALGLAVFLLAAFLGLAGIAVMLGATLDRFSWSLVLVPGLMLALALVAAWIGARPLPGPLFEQLQAQLEADRQLLRAAGEDADD